MKMKTLKTFEEHTIVNLKDTKDNLSAEYHVNIKKGKKPYIKKDGIYREVKTKTIPRNVEYLDPEKIEKYNKLARKIEELKDQLDSIIL